MSPNVGSENDEMDRSGLSRHCPMIIHPTACLLEARKVTKSSVKMAGPRPRFGGKIFNILPHSRQSERILNVILT